MLESNLRFIVEILLHQFLLILHLFPIFVGIAMPNGNIGAQRALKRPEKEAKRTKNQA